MRKRPLFFAGIALAVIVVLIAALLLWPRKSMPGKLAVVSSPEAELVAGVDQKDNKIVVYRMEDPDWNDAGSVVWQCRPSLRSGFSRAWKYKMASDAKLRYSEHYGGLVVITCASGGMVYVIDYAGGECLFAADMGKGSNPHSVELLPSGNLVVASSEDNTLTIFPALKADEKSDYRFTQPLEGAHGLSWDPRSKLLWALGGERLSAYEPGGTAEEPELIPRVGLIFDLPAPEGEYAGGHDLFPVYGTEQFYWVTTNRDIFQFNVETGQFSTDYPGHDLIGGPGAKAIGNQPYSGAVVRAVPNGTHELWDTDTADIFTFDNGFAKHESRTHKREAYYKLRVWHPDY
ncbi:MAG: WD40 repeat domain-containing protein [Oscillospiraceae bacterium]|nr:WD40 repeat domain-containing protein [Oscillospiraceae bacterium]